MTREKYVMLRKKRLKERDERLKKQRERIKEQREKERTTRVRKWVELVERKRRIEEELEKARLEQIRQKETRLEEVKREKTRQKRVRLERKRRKKASDAIKAAETVAKAFEKETEASTYVPEITTEIRKTLAEADERFRSADYAKTIKRSYEIKKVAEKAKLEISTRVQEKERKRRIKEQLLLAKKLEKERKKARKTLMNVRKAVEEAEEETELSIHVPETTKKIDENLTEADKSFGLGNYGKVIKLSHGIKELVEKARSDALRKTEEKKLEEEKRKKAKDAIGNVRTVLEETEKKTKFFLYVPKSMKEISETLTDAEKSFESADYAKVIKLTFEIKELVEKARLEASRKTEEKKRRRKREPKYLYCVVPSSEEKSFGNIGMNNKEVYTIPCKKVAAVVSDSPMKDYEMIEDNVRKHESVLRQVMKDHTIAPTEFGTVVKNEKILVRLLKKAYDPARECLKLVDNMVELGVKTVLNNDIVFADPKKRNECISEILQSLNTTAKQVVTGDLFSDRLLLNASFMVNKEDINRFSDEVTRLQEKYSMLKLLYSGPWAPYNFVYIKIGAEGMEITKKR